MNVVGWSTIFRRALIIGGNLIPLYGVLEWGWDIFSIFFLYWAENVVIGFYVLVSMIAFAVMKGPLVMALSAFTIVFFIFHYGMFCFAHVAILAQLFAPDTFPDINNPADILVLFRDPGITGYHVALAGLLLSQGFQMDQTFRTTYAKSEKIEQIMFSPYGRIVVLHLAILLGGLAAQAFGAPFGALLVLILFKTLYDLGVLTFANKDVTKTGDRS